MRAAAVLLLAAALGACGDSPCDPTSERCSYQRTTSETTVGAGEEIDGLCQSWTLDNPTELWVENVAMDNGGAYHHSNWFFVPDDVFAEPDGPWPCAEGGFDELGAALTGGYLFAQSTQVADQDQTFPPGVAVRIPPWSRLVGNTHLLNASPTTVATHMTIRIDTIPPDEVAVKLTPARIEFNALALDPLARSSFATECALDTIFQDVLSTPVDYKLYYALPHYHALGTSAQLELAGGPRDGEVVFRTDGFGEAAGVAFDPPIDVGAAGATGVRWRCSFDNPRDGVVGWGIGDQEMCVIAMFAESPIAWQGNARSSEPAGTAADGTIEHTGPCTAIGYEWDFDRPGGPPR